MPEKSDYILAVNPWIYDFTAYDLWFKPLGLLYIASFLKANGYDLLLFDCLDRKHPVLEKNKIRTRNKVDGRGNYYSEKIDKPELLKSIPRHFKRYGIPYNLVESELENIPRPRAILVTSYLTYWYLGVRDIVLLLRKIFPSVPIILGGFYAELMREHSQFTIQPDIIFNKNQMSDLLSFIDRLYSISRKRDQFSKDIIFNLPPMYSLLNHPQSLPLLTSTGCPFKCDFCITPSRWGEYRSLFPEKASDLIMQFSEKLNVQHFAFYDDALLYRKKEHLFKIIERIIKEKRDISFHTPNGIFPREIDMETANLLAEGNFKTIRLSFESVDIIRQKQMGKVTNKHLVDALRNLEKAGYKRKEIEVYLMIGLPDQKTEEVENGIKFITDLGAKAHLTYFSPIPGTYEGDSVINRYFKDDFDPLLTNKFAFLLWHPYIRYNEYEHLRMMKRDLNNSLGS